MLFGELWKQRIRGQLVSLEEGIFDYWHFGRIALAGDSAHKVIESSISCASLRTVTNAFQVTPNFALGGNSGMESVISLTNGLYRLLKASPNRKPIRSEIEAMFSRYQAQRKSRMHEIFFWSALITRLQAWDGWLLKVVQNWILPIVGDKKVVFELSKISVKAPILDFVPVTPRTGKMNWIEEQPVSLPVKTSNGVLPRTRQQLVSVAAWSFVLLGCLWSVGMMSARAI